jgi:saccharopepsin
MAAGALFGSASAGVHKMKLKKVPLSEQLVSGVMFNLQSPLD